MVGAGVLVEPLLGIPQSWGVLMVGAIVITIVATAGMASTTYVQFLKGGLLIVFSTVLVVAVIGRGFSTQPDQGGKVPFYKYAQLSATRTGNEIQVTEPGWILSWNNRRSRGLRSSSNLAMRATETWW